MLTTVVAFVVVLGVMILVHEFGHFAAAKLFGVRVEVFSLGFGKRLLGFRKGDTDYRISALPLGGYVKMAGENPLDNRSGAPDEFSSHPRWQRLIIAFAGPAMNVLLSIALLTLVYMVHFERPTYSDEKATINYVEKDSLAARAGVLRGDTIVKIDGKDNPTWEDVMVSVALSPERYLNFTVLRDGKLLPMSVTPEKNSDGQGVDPGWIPDLPNVVGKIEPGMPAAKAGILPGDQITAVNGQPVKYTREMIDILQQTKAAPVQLTVLRNGRPQQVTLTPELTNDGGEQHYRIGMTPRLLTKAVKLPFTEAFQKSVERNRFYSGLIFQLVGGMLRHRVSINQMGGPITIARESGKAARQPGWTPLLELMAMISLNLGIFNLFPIPILDGGMILMLVIEGVMQREISIQIKERVYQVAFVFLVLFAVVVFYNDIVKALPGLSHHLP